MCFMPLVIGDPEEHKKFVDNLISKLSEIKARNECIWNEVAKEIKKINEYCFAKFMNGIDISSRASNNMLIESIISLNKDNPNFDAESFRKLSGYEETKK